MGSKYSHHSEADRRVIEIKLKDRLGHAAIGRSLGRRRSTICRERERRHCHATNLNHGINKAQDES